MARGTRSHARVACEGPSPTMKGGVLCSLSFVLASPPFCSLCSPDHKRVRSGDPALQGLARERWRGTGPRPTVTSLAPRPGGLSYRETIEIG